MKISKTIIITESWSKTKENLSLWMLIMLFVFALNVFFSLVQEELFINITSRTILFSIATKEVNLVNKLCFRDK